MDAHRNTWHRHGTNDGSAHGSQSDRPAAPRTTRRVIAIAMTGAMALPIGAVTLSASPASAATVPVAAISPRAVDLSAGGAAQLAVSFRTNRPSLRWSIDGLPSGVQAGFSCSSLRSCALSLNAAANVADSTNFVELVVSNGRSRRVLPFALGVHSGGSKSGTPTPVATLPTIPPPPVTQPPATQPPSKIVRNFALVPAAIVQTARPGANVAFPITINRVGWSGPVALRVTSLPAGWRAAFVPTNPSSEGATTLLLAVPAGTRLADYPVRITGQAESSIVTSNLVVQVRVPQPVATVQSAPPIPAGTVGRMLVDVRSIDNPSMPVTLSVDGVPVGISISYTVNPTVGTVGVDFSIPANFPAGKYGFRFVASRDGVTSTTPAVLTISAAPTQPSTTFRFSPTAVAPTPGAPVAYGLKASAPSFAVVRGANGTIDITVVPTGGFTSPIDVAVDLPLGWSAVFSNVAPNVFRVTVSVPANTLPGANLVKVRSSSGNLKANLDLTATVN